MTRLPVEAAMQRLEEASALLEGMRAFKAEQKAGPLTAAQLRRLVDSYDWAKWERDLKPVLAAEFTAVLKERADRVAAGINVSFNLADPFVQKELTAYIGTRITELTATSKKRVADLIRTTLESGGAGSTNALGDLVQEAVREQFAGYADWRADRIARTETAIAYNHGTVFAARQADLTHVEVIDGDDDEECARANGQVWTLTQALNNPVAHPNCTRDFVPVENEA